MVLIFWVLMVEGRRCAAASVGPGLWRGPTVPSGDSSRTQASLSGVSGPGDTIPAPGMGTATPMSPRNRAPQTAAVSGCASSP